MSTINTASSGLAGSSLGGTLQDLLNAQDIVPGSDPSYQLCKVIYLYHPLGGKMAEAPISKAQSQQRKISVPDSPEERVRKAFLDEWKAIGADSIIFNVMSTSRVYGISAVALVADDMTPDKPIDYTKLAQQKISFNVFDPLNTAGSLVLNQNPNSPEFQHVMDLAVQGKRYHRSRTCVMMNGNPVYIAYTTSAFGYVGRSCYQRGLFPLKSFVQSMVTDDMVSLKAGVLIAKLKPVGSIVDQVMAAVAGVKRMILQQAQTGNIISIGHEDAIETLNMQNLDGAYGLARKNILENLAASDDMPAKLLNQETFAEGFGEGTEDAKYVAQYIDRFREKMEPLYVWFDKIVQYRAWNPEFYKLIQADFPERYSGVSYNQAFFEWRNSFKAEWPSLLTEPDSEKVKTEDVKLKALIATVQVLAPMLDPENRATLVQWCCDNLNASDLVFSDPLVVDATLIQDWAEEQQEQQAAQSAGGGENLEGGPQEPKQGHPFSAQDSVAAWLGGSGPAPSKGEIKQLITDVMGHRLRPSPRRLLAS